MTIDGSYMYVDFCSCSTGAVARLFFFLGKERHFSSDLCFSYSNETGQTAGVAKTGMSPSSKFCHVILFVIHVIPYSIT